jgi:hypothetical protein
MKNHQIISKNSVVCKRCGKIKILANERIKATGVCYVCVDEIVPPHIPESQHIRYLQMKGYRNRTLFIN